MKMRLISSLRTFSRLIPRKLYPAIVRRDVVDFFWHAVSNDPMPHVQHLYPVVSTSDFEASLLYLKHNFNLINYEQLHAYIFEKKDLPKKAAHLSFDDGYSECFSVVRPILLKHKIPCTFFLTTDLIDNNILFYRNKQSLCVERLSDPTFQFQPNNFKHIAPTGKIAPPPSRLPEFITWLKDLRLPDESLIDEICAILDIDWHSFLAEKQPYLNTKQILQMHAKGFTLGAHTLSHRKLVDLTDADIETEIIQSCQIIGEITGQEIVPFSFPNSAYGLDRDHLSAIRTNNRKIGLLFDTKGLRRDVDFIQNRVWVERPIHYLPEKGDVAKMVQEHLHLAYQEAWIDEIMEKGRNLLD